MRNLLLFLLAISPLQAEECLNTRLFFLGGYAVGTFIDIDSNYGETGAVLFGSTNNYLTTFFSDTQFFFLKDSWCLSAGGGLRQYVQSAQAFVGANLYYDYRNYNNAHDIGKTVSLNRVGFGFEYLSRDFETRFNAYIPVGRTIVKGPPTEFIYPDPFDLITATARRARLAFYGFDGEVGLWLFQWQSLRFYASGGVYYFTTRTKNFKDFGGGYGRAILTWNDYVNLEMRASSDKVYHGRVEGLLWIQLPFDFILNGLYSLPCCPPTCCEQLWQRPVYRHSILGAGKCCCYDDWNWPSIPR